MPEQIQNLEQAEKILDYWYAIEFLAQDKFDDMWEIRSKFLRAQDVFTISVMKWHQQDIKHLPNILKIKLKK